MGCVGPLLARALSLTPDNENEFHNLPQFPIFY
jgi:hypothetical protein